MKIPLSLISIFILISCRTPEQPRVEKTIEDGVEVVVNHREPYKIEGEPITLHLEEEFVIDTEKNETAERGVTDMGAFDVDSEGNIYFFQERESDRNLVYKFDKNGRFIASFGKRGQGPGEIQSPIYLIVSGQDEIPIQDYGRPRLFVFDKTGAIIRETNLITKSIGLSVFYPLQNGNYLKFRDYSDPSVKHRYDIAELTDSKFGIIKELDRCDYGLFGRIAQKVKGSPRVFIIEVRDGKIYLGHENRGYEILVYDLNGKMARKIRKEYEPVGASEEFKKILISNFELVKDKLIVPEKMPPFHYFFSDDEGRLYVKTYKQGNNKHEFIHDVFNADGVFIMRVSLPGFGSWMYPGRDLNRAKTRNNRFYCLREKENGYIELVVNKMTWR